MATIRVACYFSGTRCSSISSGRRFWCPRGTSWDCIQTTSCGRIELSDFLGKPN